MSDVQVELANVVAADLRRSGELTPLVPDPGWEAEGRQVHDHRHSPAAVRDRLIFGDSYSTDGGE